MAILRTICLWEQVNGFYPFSVNSPAVGIYNTLIIIKQGFSESHISVNVVNSSKPTFL